MIEIEEEELNSLILAFFLYTIGRNDGLTFCVGTYIEKHKKLLTPKTKNIMIQNITYFIENNIDSDKDVIDYLQKLKKVLACSLQKK